MNLDEYYILFHKENLNLVAFKRVVECSEEILSLVNAAIDAERKEWVGLSGTQKLGRRIDLPEPLKHSSRERTHENKIH